MMGTQDDTTRDFSLGVVGTKMRTRSLDDALHAAELDGWDVHKAPLSTYVDQLEADGVTRLEVPVPGKFAVVRKTVNETIPYRTLGVVGDRYSIVQNEQSFGFVDDLLHIGGEELHVDFAGSMYDGRKVFLDVKLPDTIMVGGFDPVDMRLLCVNTHDGTSPFSLSLHINRIACTNQIVGVMRRAKAAQMHWSLRHTSSIEGRVQIAREQLQLTMQAVDEFEAEAQQLIAKSVNERQVERMIESVFPIAHDATAKARTDKLATRTHVRTIYRESPTQESIKGTAWGLLNAFVEYADWSREVRPGKDGDARQARALAQLDSRHVANFKSNVMERVLALK